MVVVLFMQVDSRSIFRDVNRTAIVTAGHSIYIHFREDGEYAAKVTV